MVDGEIPAGTPQAREDFVGDEKHVVTVTDLADNGVVFRRWRRAGNGCAQNGLCNERGNGIGADFVDRVLEFARTLHLAIRIFQSERAVIAVRRGNPGEVVEVRFEVTAPRITSRRRKCCHRVAVITQPAPDNYVPAIVAAFAMILPRDLDRDLVRLRSAASENRSRQVAGAKLSQLLGEYDAWFVGEVTIEHEGDSLKLLGHLPIHVRKGVADRRHTDAGPEIEILLAGVIVQTHAFGAGDDGIARLCAAIEIGVCGFIHQFPPLLLRP